ncbi:MAG TPA: hypothetical protein VLL25_12720 [Acidimicrobiales bacterium]|nr:hypothetical protein [Acidimicrobiales bacterium]
MRAIRLSDGDDRIILRIRRPVRRDRRQFLGHCRRVGVAQRGERAHEGSPVGAGGAHLNANPQPHPYPNPRGRSSSNAPPCPHPWTEFGGHPHPGSDRPPAR